MTPPAPSHRLAALVVGSVVAVAAALVLMGGGMVGAKRSARAGDAYTRFVQSQFIDRGRLIVRTGGDLPPGVPIVDLADDIYNGKDPAAWRYAVESFLLEDIRRNDLSIWTIENGRVTNIATSAHRTPPPFHERRAWAGSVLYRTPPPASDATDLLLSPRGWAGPTLRLTPLNSPLATGDPRIRAVRLGRDAPGEIAAPAFDLYCGAGAEPAVKVRRIGDQVGVWTTASNACGVQVLDRSLGEQGFAALGLGELLSVEAPDGRRLSYQRIFPPRGERALSAPTPSGQRARDPAGGWWSVAIENDYLRALPDHLDGALRGDFRTSLDPVLHAGAQQRLDAYVAQHPGPRDGQPNIGAVTVMDAMTGEVLAMATTPRSPLSSTEVVDRDDEGARARRVNQNLQLLPIGSAAKPLIAAALVADQPQLADLRIPAVPETNNLLGMPFRSSLKTHAVGSTVSFESFVQHSDNIYAAALLLLGSADVGGHRCRLPPGQSYADATGTHATRPKSIFETVGRDGYCRPAPPESTRQLRWAVRLAELFDVNIGARGRQDPRFKAPNCVSPRRLGDDIHDVAPWRALFSDRPGLQVCRFTESAPFREALSIETAQDFRQDLLPMMLGNGEGRWSAVKVAEAYSRLVTGRRVSASFTPVRAARGGPLDPAFTARARLTHALTLVPFGTAANTGLPGALTAVEEQLAGTGLVLGAFAKTGTPVTPRPNYAPVDQAINLLIAHGRLSLAGGGRLQLGTGAGRVLIGPEATASERREAVALLSRDRVMSEARDRFGARPRTVVDQLVRDARRLADGESPFVIERNSLLVRVGARRDDGGDTDDADLPHGKVLALVVAVYDPRQPTRPGWGPLRVEAGRAYDGAALPVRAYTVIVSLQNPFQGGENGAADLAAAIVHDLLAARLARGEGEP